MSSQTLLFEPGRPTLPPRVSVFASGANTAREIRGFGLAGVSVGVSVSLVREDAICELLRTNGRVFADSGAFSEVEFDADGMHVVAPISQLEWRRRIAIYKRLAAALGANASVVAPDRVADQKTTLTLLSRYRAAMTEIAALGAQVLIPVQHGELSPVEFYRQAVETAGLDLVPAMPMKKAARSFADVIDFVRAVCPKRIHMLGMGYETVKARQLVAHLHAIAPEMEISLDSNRLRAVTGKGRRMTLTEARLRTAEPKDIFGAIKSEAIAGAGHSLDYTDAIAEPSTWATKLQLKIIAEITGLGMREQRDLFDDPDGFLQSPAGEDAEIAYIELPHIAHALDCAWKEYVATEHNRAVRTADVRMTFAESRIAHRLKSARRD